MINIKCAARNADLHAARYPLSVLKVKQLILGLVEHVNENYLPSGDQVLHLPFHRSREKGSGNVTFEPSSCCRRKFKENTCERLWSDLFLHVSPWALVYKRSRAVQFTSLCLMHHDYHLASCAALRSAHIACILHVCILSDADPALSSAFHGCFQYRPASLPASELSSLPFLVHPPGDQCNLLSTFPPASTSCLRSVSLPASARHINPVKTRSNARVGHDAYVHVFFCPFHWRL
jgi:hypothetical protein